MTWASRQPLTHLARCDFVIGIPSTVEAFRAEDISHTLNETAEWVLRMDVHWKTVGRHVIYCSWDGNRADDQTREETTSSFSSSLQGVRVDSHRGDMVKRWMSDSASYMFGNLRGMYYRVVKDMLCYHIKSMQMVGLCLQGEIMEGLRLND